MQQFTLLTKEDIKSVVLEALSESKHQQQQPQPEKYIYGLKGLAKFFGVGITKAWQLKNSGTIPFYQTGKKLFFKESEVLQATANDRRGK